MLIWSLTATITYYSYQARVLPTQNNGSAVVLYKPMIHSPSPTVTRMHKAVQEGSHIC